MTILIFCVWFQILNANPRAKLRVRVTSLGSLPGYKNFNIDKFYRFFPRRVRRYSSFAFGFRFLSLIVFPGVNPDPNPGAKLRVRVRISLGSLPGYKIFHLHKFQSFFPGLLRRYSSFAFGFRFLSLIVFPGVNPNPHPRAKLRVSLGSLPG